MSELKRVGILIGGLVVLVVLGALLEPGNPQNDRAKWRRSVRAFHSAIERQFYIRGYLPRTLAEPLIAMVADKPIKAFIAQEDAFLASGFLTNVSMTWTNTSTSFSNSLMTLNRESLDHVILQAVDRDTYLLMSLAKGAASVKVKLICLSQDVPTIRSVLESTFNDMSRTTQASRQGGAALAPSRYTMPASP